MNKFFVSISIIMRKRTGLCKPEELWKIKEIFVNSRITRKSTTFLKKSQKLWENKRHSCVKLMNCKKWTTMNLHANFKNYKKRTRIIRKDSYVKLMNCKKLKEINVYTQDLRENIRNFWRNLKNYEKTNDIFV